MTAPTMRYHHEGRYWYNKSLHQWEYQLVMVDNTPITTSRVANSARHARACIEAEHENPATNPATTAKYRREIR